jgi:4-diphosphocytidyl-2-C-methyl-D-erythritol kinase
MTGRFTLRARAKINLNLRVLGRRPDGYHEIETVLQTISLHDSLVFEPVSGAIDFEVAGTGDVPGGESNLVLKAVAALAGFRPRGAGARVRLEKSIPVGAGLGGGSSDAAAALVGLCRLWGVRPSEDDLRAAAVTLGADVPFFLTGGTALATGIGTAVESLPDLDGYALLVVSPGVKVATAEVYARVRPPLTPALKISSMARFIPTLRGGSTRGAEEWVRAGNDLEPYARELCPAIGVIKDRLIAAGASVASMSGSGSSVFGIFRDERPLGALVRELESAGYAAFRCQPIGRSDYRRDLGIA